MIVSRANATQQSLTKEERQAAGGNVHPTAVIDPGAIVPASCLIGPYCVIGEDVEMGEHCELM